MPPNHQLQNMFSAPPSGGAKAGPRPSIADWSFIKMARADATIQFTGVNAQNFINGGIGAPVFSYVSSTPTEAQYYKGLTPAAAGDSAQVSDSLVKIELNNFSYFETRVYLPGAVSTNNIRVWIGMMDCTDGGNSGNLQTSTPPAFAGLPSNVVAFRFNPASDSSWTCYVGTDSTHQTIVNTGVPVDISGAGHVFAISQTILGTINFFIDGVLVGAISSNLPTGTTRLAIVNYAEARTANAIA